MGRLDAALECADALIVLDKYNGMYYATRASILTDLKRYDQATKDADIGTLRYNIPLLTLLSNKIWP
jgi:tetratricopeptide (TPR) repeat protein